MMTSHMRGWWWISAITLSSMMPVWAAEETAPAASAPTAQGTPAITGSAMSDLLPAGTVFYKGWPGIEIYSKAAKDTELAKLLKEPELQRLRTAWWKEIWPAIEDKITAELDNEGKQQVYEVAKSFLSAAWDHPTAVALIGAGVAQTGPQLDAAIIIRAGKDAGKLGKGFENLLAIAHLSTDTAEEIALGGMKFKQLAVAGSPVLLRWGEVKGVFIVSIGAKATEHLATGSIESSLSRSPRFVAAMKHAGGRQDAPFVYLDLKGVVAIVEGFQPMLASTSVPFFAEPGAVQRLVKQIGLEACESLSIAMVPEEKGFKTSMFLHLPGANSSSNPLIGRKPLINDDIGVVPRSARWATVANWDAAATYQSLVEMLKGIVPGGEEEVARAIESAEKRLGVSIEEDILGAFENNWAIFDSPDFGGLWFTGVVMVAKVKPDNRLSKAMRNILEVVVEEVGGEMSANVATEEYRGQKIEYVNIGGVPLPFAPAWAEYQNRWIVALYPQMVRMELDHLMNRGPSLLDNPDYQRGRKLMPGGPYSVAYVDSKAGVQQMYSLVLPLWQAAAAMLRSEDIPIDAGLLPSAQTVARHLFGDVSASAATEDGVLTVSHTAMPLALPAIGGGAFLIPLGLSVAMPSLTEARGQAKRTVSIANLRGIGVALYTYAAENQDKFPPDLKMLVDSGAISPQALRSPLDESDATSSYVFISGQSTEVDQRNVIAYENPENYDNEGTVVLFADAHVEYMTMQSFRKALEDTYRRLGREVPEETGATEVDTSPAGQVKTARLLVGREGALAGAIELFKNQVGRYPNKLDELLKRPEEEAAAEKWSGPYVQKEDMLKDPWGHTLMYLSSGEHNRDGYDLWSVGPDGKDGTDDDVANWKK